MAMSTAIHRKPWDFATAGSTSVARRSDSRRFRFTKKTVQAIPAPTNGQRSYYYDAEVRGLTLAVSPLGKKTFILYRKVNGRPERITIGPFLDLSIEQARKEAQKLNGDIARGQNPADRKREVREEATLNELFATYLEHHAKPHKRTWADDVAMFNFYLRHWQLRKISSIQKMAVVMLHTRIGKEHGQYAANRVIELLRSMFNKAIEWGWKGDNPAAKIEPFKEKKRERFLEAGELPAFFKALSEELNTTIRDYILISLLVGGRRSNVQAMAWTELNWDRASWTIPADKAKEGETITVPLSPVAIRILEARKANATSEWVFPGKGRTGHLVEPKKAWKRILRQAKLTDLRLHDLRRTLGSWQAATGASLPIIGKSLGHRDSSTTEIYARLNLDPVRAAVNKANEAMLLAGGFAGLLEEAE